MNINPNDIVTILTAAAPIVASIASGMNVCNNNRPVEPQIERTVNVTINNHFYTNTEADAVRAASVIQSQLAGPVLSSGSRYNL